MSSPRLSFRVPVMSVLRRRLMGTMFMRRKDEMLGNELFLKSKEASFFFRRGPCCCMALLRFRYPHEI